MRPCLKTNKQQKPGKKNDGSQWSEDKGKKQALWSALWNLEQDIFS
jgi:hypothetical protein